MDTFARGLEWWALSTEDLFAVVGDALRGLCEKADAGDDAALRALLHAAINATNSIEGFQATERGKVLVSSVTCWPVVLPARRKERQEVISKIDALGLGVNCELNLLGRFDENAPLTKVVLKVYGLLTSTVRRSGKPGMPILFNGEVTESQLAAWREWVIANAKKLPKHLTRANARIWATMTEPVLRIFWGRNFEHHPDFSRCGSAAQILSLWRQSWRSIASAKSSIEDE